MRIIHYEVDWCSYYKSQETLRSFITTDVYQEVVNKIILDKIYFDCITTPETIEHVAYLLKHSKSEILRNEMRSEEDRLKFARFLVNILPQLSYQTKTHLIDYMPVE